MMEIEALNENNKDEWNNFCLTSNDAWFRHTTHWMDYIMRCRFDSNSRNHSFLVRQNREIAAIVPLISQYCYTDRTVNEFANYDTPTPYWALKNDAVNINKQEVIKCIVSEIKRISTDEHIQKSKFFIDPLIANNFYADLSYYNLLKYGYGYKIKTTNILDIAQPEEYILQNMRKGHKSDIKRALKDTNIRIDFFDSSSAGTAAAFMEFKKIHIIDAGRQTRTDASWNCQLQWLLQDYAALVMAWHKELARYVCGAYILVYKGRAYYGSFATIDSALNNAILGHLIQWETIKYLKKKEINIYEIGWNYYTSSFENEYDKKLMDISKFKAGFGGREILLLEYYFPAA